MFNQLTQRDIDAMQKDRGAEACDPAQAFRGCQGSEGTW